MKNKTILMLALVLCLWTLVAVSSGAETYYGSADWNIIFTSEGTLSSSFSNAALTEAVAGLQPGDDITFTLNLINQNSEGVKWYMLNEVLYSLEDRSGGAATGGAYTYDLSYTDAAGQKTVLFSSDTVGGEGESFSGGGLHEATDALRDYFFLDSMAPGQTGVIRLKVALDGETQGNGYIDTLADLRFRFAAETDPNVTPPPSVPQPEETPQAESTGEVEDLPSPSPSPASDTRSTVVRTGDDTELLPYVIAMAFSGILLLVIAIASLRRRKREKGKTDHED